MNDPSAVMPLRATAVPAELGVGILGCGERIRAVVARVLRQVSHARVIAVHDPEQGAVEAARQAFGEGVEGRTSVAAVVEDPTVDWVFVGSWNCYHAEQVVAALRAGKHVFAEKPLATSVEGCLAIRDAVDAGPGTFTFGLVLRYAGLYRRLHELVREGKIGRLVSMEFNETLHFNHGGYIMGCWRRHREHAGPHLLEKCCHDFDLVNWITRSLPVRAASFGGNSFFTPDEDSQRQRVGLGPQGQPPFTWPATRRANPFTNGKDIVDHQVAILEYANGVKATFHTNLCAGIPERRMYLVGTEGALRADLTQGKLEFQPVAWDSSPQTFEDFGHDGHGGGDASLAHSVAQTMIHGAPPLTSLTEGLHATIACLGVDRALDEGCVVDLRPLWEEAGVELASPETCAV